MDETCGEDGFCAFDVLCPVDQSGQGTVVEKLLRGIVGGGGRVTDS